MEWFENDDFWRDFYPFMFSDERFAATPDEVSRILALTQCAGGSVLDLCCGPGRHSIELAQRGFKVTGVDRSPFLLAKPVSMQPSLALPSNGWSRTCATSFDL